MSDNNYKVINIAAGLWTIEIPFVRSYLAVGEKKALLIDTAMGDLQWKEIIGNITDLPIIAVNTHGHEDHCRGDFQFGEVYVNPLEMPEVRKYSGLENANLLPLSDHEIIDLGGWQFEVVYTPGHTFGSTSFLDLTFRRLFVGDLVISGMVIMQTEVNSLLTEKYRDTMRMLYSLRDKFDGLYSSHAEYPLDNEWLAELGDLTDDALSGKAEPEPYNFTPAEGIPPLVGDAYGTGRARLLFIKEFKAIV